MKKHLPENTVRDLLNIFSRKLSDKEDVMEEILDIQDMWDNIISKDDILNWDYSISDGILTLKSYVSDNADVIIKPRYVVNNIIYDNIKLQGTVKNTFTFNKSPKIETIKILRYGENVISSTESMYGMFSTLMSLRNISGLGNIDTRECKNFSWMFYYCEKLESLDMTSFDISNSENISYMFSRCTNLKEILVSKDKWVVNEGCNTYNMFTGCGVDHVTFEDGTTWKPE